MRPRYWMFTVLLLLLGCGQGTTQDARADNGGYSALVEIYEAFEELRTLDEVDGMPDYRPETLEAQRRDLEALQSRLRAIDPTDWPVSEQVDYHVVRTKLNDLEFQHRAVRPWERDPNLYVDLVRRTPYADVPVEDADSLAAQLQAVPRLLDLARSNLTSASSGLTDIAVRQLERFDGVGQGIPAWARQDSPEGVIGWYGNLVERLEADGGNDALLEQAQTALAAVESFRDWLREEQPGMTEPAGVGLDEYQWFLHNVRLIPISVETMREIADREAHRALSFLTIEYHRNRNLPPLEPARTEEDHARRVQEAEDHIREFVTENELMTIPDFMPDRFETDAYWTVRPDNHLHFWEALTYRDPRNNHVHASIPGHRFDFHIQRRNPNPIRATHRDSGRAEGWAFYLEEMLLQAGLLDELPRAKELFYIAIHKRALRIPAEHKMQTGEFSLDDAIDYFMEHVDLMDEDLARYDLNMYMRRPTAGMSYTIGKNQMEELLAERKHQLGDEFHLGEFHDEFLSKGPIPISLIRWEMTGNDEAIRKLWNRNDR